MNKAIVTKDPLMLDRTYGSPRSHSLSNPANGSPYCKDIAGERPVGPEEAAAFLKIARATVLALARAGKIPAHPVTNGRRKRWLFFLSELEAYVRALSVNCGRHPCANREESKSLEAHS